MILRPLLAILLLAALVGCDGPTIAHLHGQDIKIICYSGTWRWDTNNCYPEWPTTTTTVPSTWVHPNGCISYSDKVQIDCPSDNRLEKLKALAEAAANFISAMDVNGPSNLVDEYTNKKLVKLRKSLEALENSR